MLKGKALAELCITFGLHYATQADEFLPFFLYLYRLMWHKCYAVARLNYPSNVTFSIIVNGAPQKKNSRIIHFMGKLLVQL